MATDLGKREGGGGKGVRNRGDALRIGHEDEPPLKVGPQSKILNQSPDPS